VSAPKLRISTEWLSGCGGCHVGIVDLHEKILDVLGEVELLRCPVLADKKDYPQADIGIIEGAIRSEHDRHAAIAMRKACKKIVAFGTCAVYGGISGGSLAHSREEILDAVFRKNPTTKASEAPAVDVSPLERMVTPLDEVIPVDLYLPGCPPHAAFIFDALISLARGRQPKAKQEAVCGNCRRDMVKSEVAALKADHEGIPDEKQCFLSQGYLCLGSVTLDRCLAPCPQRGVPCTGCAGPTQQILTEPNRDLRTEVAERVARLTKIAPEAVMRAMEASAKTHYAYAMATRMIGKKPTFLIDKWIADVEAKSS
jgi:F420-non-reducing hydrogenase small subunit